MLTFTFHDFDFIQMYEKIKTMHAISNFFMISAASFLCFCQTALSFFRPEIHAKLNEEISELNNRNILLQGSERLSFEENSYVYFIHCNSLSKYSLSPSKSHCSCNLYYGAVYTISDVYISTRRFVT